MTDLEKEAIEILRELYSYQKGKAIPGTDDYIFNKEYKATGIVLNLIERQQREKELHIKLEQQYKKEYLDTKEEIEKYKEMYATSIATRVNEAFKQEYKNNEDLEMLYKGCQIELEKKDKIIDLMAEWFEEWAEFIDEENYYTIFRKMSKEDIKEYFKKKVEDK